NRPGEVGGRRADDEPLVRRLRDAPPLRDRGRTGRLRESLPGDQGLSRGEGEGRDRLLRVRHGSVPHPVRAGLLHVLPKISDNAKVNLVKRGERYISMTETPIPVEFDGETLDAAGVAYKAPGLLTTAHPHLDRASGGMLNYAAKLGPRNRYR